MGAERCVLVHRAPSAPEASSASTPPAEANPVLSELEAQKAYMRQKVQQRQQEAKMQQQQQVSAVRFFAAIGHV